MTNSTSPSSPERPGLTPQVLQIIRFSILATVIVLGLLIWFITGEQGPVEPEESILSLLRIIYIAILGGAAVGLFVLRARVQQPVSFRKRSTLILAGYALAEAPALFGAILLLVTGSGLPYLVGILLLLMAFVVLPIPSGDDR